MKSILITISLLSLLVLLSCKKGTIATYDCTGVSATYTADIAPVLTTHCTSCHNSSNKKGRIDLSTYDEVTAIAGEDRFMGSIQHVSGYRDMPRGASKLDDATIKMISCWIQSGMPR